MGNRFINATTLLLDAKRPVVIAGVGIRYADQVEEFRVFAEKLQFPVVTSWSGLDLLPHNLSYYIGQTGVYGSRAANFAVQNADCILALGTRLDTRITGGKPETFARKAKKIVVDIDRAELYKGRGLTPDVGICRDIKDVLPHLLVENDVSEWLKKCQQWKKQYPTVLPEWRKSGNPYYFIEKFSKIIPYNAIVITDCGGNLTWTMQAFSVNKHRVFSSFGNSPMGYSLAGAIGACFATREPIYCIIGDGGLQVNIQELQTIRYYNLPIHIFVLNNHSYGIIKQFQEIYFEGRYVATTPQSGYSVPDFIKIANAYGINAKTVIDYDFKVEEPPHLYDVIIDDDSKLIPKLEFGRPIHDLSPLLSRSELERNMYASR